MVGFDISLKGCSHSNKPGRLKEGLATCIHYRERGSRDAAGGILSIPGAEGELGATLLLRSLSGCRMGLTGNMYLAFALGFDGALRAFLLSFHLGQALL